MRNLKNRYEMHRSPIAIFADNRVMMETFGRTFYKAFLFAAIPKYKLDYPQTRIESCVELKKHYAEIFNSTKTGQRSFIL